MYKVLWVALAVFLWLTVNIPDTGETDQVVQFDYLETPTSSEHFANAEVEDILASILAILDEGSVESNASNSSTSSKATDFDSLCSSEKTLCNITTFNGSFSDTEKFSYLKQLQFLITELDNSAKRGNALKESLKIFVVNKAKADRRGSAGWSKITLNLGGMKYDNEYFQVLTHEMGHIMDLGSLQWASKTKHSNFTEFGKSVFAIDDPSIEYYKYSWQSESIRKSWVKKQDFCSGYGMSDPFEDFAECHNLYLNHQDVFKSLARINTSLKNKYNYFANLYGWTYLSNSILSPNDLSSDRRAWDTTRIEE